MSGQLHHYAYCHCGDSVITELRAIVDEYVERAYVKCPGCGDELEFQLSWQCVSAELLTPERAQ